MLVYGALTETLHRLLRELIGVAGTKRLSGAVSFLAVCCEPLEYRVLVLPHPLNVGFRLLQSLLQSPGARAKARVLVILLKLLQLPGKQSVRSGLALKNSALRGEGLPSPLPLTRLTGPWGRRPYPVPCIRS